MYRSAHGHTHLSCCSLAPMVGRLCSKFRHKAKICPEYARYMYLVIFPLLGGCLHGILLYYISLQKSNLADSTTTLEDRVYRTICDESSEVRRAVLEETGSTSGDLCVVGACELGSNRESLVSSLDPTCVHNPFYLFIYFFWPNKAKNSRIKLMK